MTKKELLEKVSEIANAVSDMEETVGTLRSDIRKISNLLDEIPEDDEETDEEKD